MDEVLFFIDSGFVSKLSKHFGGGNYIKFKLKDFVSNLCYKNKFISKKIFYYTAPPYQSNNPKKLEIKRKEKYDSFRNSLLKEGVVVREGRVQRLRLDGKYQYKQKGVDTLLTIDLSHVKEDFPSVKKIVLISSDTDFVPIIEDISKRGLEIILFTYFDRKRNSPFSLSNHLLRVCSRYVKLTKEDFEGVKNE